MGKRKERYYKKKSGSLFQKKRITSNNQSSFITKVRDDNITQELNFEANSWNPIQVKFEAEDLDKNDVGDQSSVRHEDNTLLEDLKPSTDTLQESLSSARLELAECNIDCICRLCGTKLSQEECTLSDNNVFCYNYPDMITSCTSLKVVQGDGLPHKMCVQCIANLNMAYDFRNVCIETCNILMRSTFNRSLETNSTDSKLQYTEITHIEILPTDDNKDILDGTDSQAKKELNTLALCDDQKVFDDNISSSDIDYHETKPNVDYEEEETEQTMSSNVKGQGSDGVVNKSGINNDTSFGNNQNWSEVPFEKMEIEQAIFDLKSIAIATKDIVKYRCPTPKSNIVHEIDYQKEKKRKLRLSAKRKTCVPPILRASREEGHLCLAESNKKSTPVEKDTVGDCMNDNTDCSYEQNKNEGFCDDINRTKIHGDIGSTHLGDGNWLENQLEEEETEKPLFILSYPSNTKKNIIRAKTEIKKACCPTLKHGGAEVLCPFCPAVIDVELYNEIQQHLDSHIHIANRYVCRYDNCNESFQTNLSRKIHQNTDHGTQKLKMRKKPCKWLCDHCAIMVGPYDYRQHIDRKKHMLRKVYFCDKCSFRTDSKSRIRLHIEGLHNSKRIRCKLCDKMVPLNKVRYHMDNQHEAKIPCKYCNKEFLRRNMNGHLRTHTGEKPFSCSDCGMEFTFRVSLKTHRKRYHGEHIFKGTTEL